MSTLFAVVWIAIALAVAIDGLAGLAGGLLPERWVRRHMAMLVAFAAGALLGAAFVDLLPEAVRDIGAGATTWAFGGFLAAAAIESIVGTHHHEHEGEPGGTLPRVLLASDALHNTADGAAMAAAFLASMRVGIVAAFAVIAHELPQEIGDFALLRRAGWTRRRALAALALVQCTAVVGAIGVVVAAEAMSRVAPRVIAIAAGTFLYIGAADLLPELRAAAPHAHATRGQWAGFAAGVLATLIARYL